MGGSMQGQAAPAASAPSLNLPATGIQSTETSTPGTVNGTTSGPSAVPATGQGEGALATQRPSDQMEGATDMFELVTGYQIFDSLMGGVPKEGALFTLPGKPFHEKSILPSATLFMLGVEVIFSSFFLSLLGLNRR
jgi:hypothetical protein